MDHAILTNNLLCWKTPLSLWDNFIFLCHSRSKKFLLPLHQSNLPAASKRQAFPLPLGRKKDVSAHKIPKWMFFKKKMMHECFSFFLLFRRPQKTNRGCWAGGGKRKEREIKQHRNYKTQLSFMPVGFCSQLVDLVTFPVTSEFCKSMHLEISLKIKNLHDA